MRHLPLLALAIALPLAAAPITIPASSNGFYSSNGVTVSTSGYFTGNCANCAPHGEFRAYVVFTLAPGLSTISSATLSLPFGNSVVSGYNSNDPSETLGLFDVSTTIATLTSGVGSLAVFTDLGTGAAFGSVVVLSSTVSPGHVDVVLNAAGLAYLNSRIGSSAAFGLALTSLGFNGSDEVLFNGSGASHPSLAIDSTGAATPEPSTVSLVLVGGLLALVNRFRRPTLRKVSPYGGPPGKVKWNF